MEFMSDIERFEHGVLGHDCDAALAVAAMQLTVEPVTLNTEEQ